jgi:hypothetical protein
MRFVESVTNFYSKILFPTETRTVLDINVLVIETNSSKKFKLKKCSQIEKSKTKLLNLNKSVFSKLIAHMFKSDYFENKSRQTEEL